MEQSYDHKLKEAAKRLDELASSQSCLEEEAAQYGVHFPKAGAGASRSTPTQATSKSPTDQSNLISAADTTSELPSQTSSRQSAVSKRVAHVMDNLQSNIFTASQRLNDLTGYTGIEQLKASVESQEELVLTARQQVKDLRAAYSTTVATRATTQREVNDLLHRKHNWSASDLERFTNLYRSDHANEQAEMAAQATLFEAESKYEEASGKLATTILSRYHEEQIWSDKIRQMSTWGTWGLMGLNVLLFIVFQIAIEPWRRRRLVKGFEEKVEEALAAVSTTSDDLLLRSSTRTSAAAQPHDEQHVADTLAGAIVDAVTGSSTTSPSSASPQPQSQVQVETAIEAVTDQELSSDDLSFPTPLSHISPIRQYIQDLLSPQKFVTLSHRDLTAVAVEGAVAGAAVVGLLLVLLRPR